MKRITIILLAIIFASGLLNAQFQSVRNGNWDDPLTWSNDPDATAIPDSNYSVTISHHVVIKKHCDYWTPGPRCFDLVIDSTGYVMNQYSASTCGNLEVFHDFINYGTFIPGVEISLIIKGNLYNYGLFTKPENSTGNHTITLFGDLINYGSFRAHGWSDASYIQGLTFDGGGAHKIRTFNDSTIFISHINLKDSTNYIVIDSVASVSAIINLHYSKILLPTDNGFDNTLYLESSEIYTGTIEGNNQTIIGKEGTINNLGKHNGDAWSNGYLTVKDVNLYGDFLIVGASFFYNIGIITFEGQNNFYGTMAEYWPFGVLHPNTGIVIKGEFINYGEIFSRKERYDEGFHVNVDDNSAFINLGTLGNASLNFRGNCQFYTEDSIGVKYFTAEDSNTVVTVLSEELYFKDRTVYVNFNGGTLNLSSGGIFETTDSYNKIYNTNLMANNSTITFNYVDANVTINNPKIKYVEVRSNTVFTGNTEITEGGSLLAYSSSYYPTVTINGNLSNYGAVRNHYTYGSLILEVTGNILHDGNRWDNYKTKLIGTDDQSILIPNDSAWAGRVVLEAMLTGTNYQWQKDGVDIAGANSAQLTFASGLNSSDYGNYQCIVDGTPSRNIFIGNAPPAAFEITNVQISVLSDSTAQINWHTTVPATGFIFYAENDTTSGFPNEAMEPNVFVTEHNMLLENLNPNSTYYFIIDQHDSEWNNIRSGTFSFVAGEIPQTPIAYWKFDEESWNGTEGEVIDETGNYNGTTRNGTTPTSGISGNAAAFDGIDDYITIGATLSPSGELSVSAWFLDNGVTISQQWYNDYIISKGNDLAETHNSWGLHVWDENLDDSLYGYGFMTVTNQELNWTASPTESIIKGKWYNIVGVIASDTSYLYLNGELINKKHLLGSIEPSDLIVNIGKIERAGCEYYFNGKIDEVKVYNRPLSQEEIINDYLQYREDFEITNVQINSVTSTQAEITWNTNYAATGFVFYAENDTTNGFPNEATEPNVFVTEHSMLLENLTPNSTYYFIIDQHDRFMENIRSETYSFTTEENISGGAFIDSLNTLHKLTTLFDEEGSGYYDGAFISKDIAYIVTNHNRLFKTTDGGNTWINISPEQGTSFDSVGNTPRVSFINENIGAVAFSVDDGANGYDTDKTFAYVWCTTDGGETWSERFDVNDDQILHLNQASETVTYVSGAAHLGVSSTRWFKKITRNPADNSYTLTNIATTPTSRPHVISGDWLNAENGAILARLNYGDYTLGIFKTTNGGNSWNNIQSNLPTMNNPSISFSDRGIRMIDENRIVLATYSTIYSDRDASIYYTVDGGTSWTKGYIPDSPVSLTSLSFDVTGENGIVCGNSSTDSSKVFYFSTDYAQNWEAFLLPEMSTPISLYAGEITSDGAIWIIGSNQSIWKSGHLTGIEGNDENSLPTDFSLSQNYPNPFNPSTVINFQLPESGFVTLKIYDILGHEVATLVNELRNAGNYKITFDATELSTGIYFYRLQSGKFNETKKMILIK